MDMSDITEVLVEFGDDVLAHQKCGNQHRLILCHRPPPQEASEWVNKGNAAVVSGYVATWDEVEKL